MVSTGTENPARGPTAFDGVTSSQRGLREEYDKTQATLLASTPGNSANGAGLAPSKSEPVRSIAALAHATGTERADVLALSSVELEEWLQELKTSKSVALDVMSVAVIKREHGDRHTKPILLHLAGQPPALSVLSQGMT